MQSAAMKLTLLLALTFCAYLPLSAAEPAGPPADMGGWEQGSDYNRHYDPLELDSFKGDVVKIEEEAPMPGMSPGVIIHVREGEEINVVHLCPTWYRQASDIAIKPGERVKVKGVWAEIDGKFVFMASKIKKGDFYDLKVRLTSSGKPFWTMRPEELAQEERD
jgi:hypothetical protein